MLGFSSSILVSPRADGWVRGAKPVCEQVTHSTSAASRKHGAASWEASLQRKPSGVSRRAMVSLLAGCAMIPRTRAALASRLEAEVYDSNKTRRYVDIGRPTPDRAAPKFVSDKPIFKIDDALSAQDVEKGKGDTVDKGTLVVARWLAVLADGTTVDAANETQIALFRPGAHQVPPGIEDAVIGMRAGGVRRVAGSSDRILSNISVGVDIGERSLVPTGSLLYVDICVDGTNPFGRPR